MVHYLEMADIEFQQFKLRIPVKLKELLERSAEDQDRSLSAEIIHRLERSYGGVNGVLISHRFLELAMIDSQLFSLESSRFAMTAQISNLSDEMRIKELRERVQAAEAEITRLRSIRNGVRDTLSDLTSDIDAL